MQATRQIWVVTALLAMAAPTAAFGQANCRNSGAFEPWLADFKKEAAAKGISQSTIAAASPYLVLDQRIINIDRGQRFFAQNFLEISDKMLAGGRLPNGAAQMKKHDSQGASEYTPGHKMQDKGPKGDAPGASGYAPGHQSKNTPNDSGSSGSSTGTGGNH